MSQFARLLGSTSSANFCPPSVSGDGHFLAGCLAYRILVAFFGAFSDIFLISADPNVTNRIRSHVSVTGHTIVKAPPASLFEFTAFKPDTEPFLKRKKKHVTAFGGVFFVAFVSISDRVICFLRGLRLSRQGFSLFGGEGFAPLTHMLSAVDRYVSLTHVLSVFFTVSRSPCATCFAIIDAARFWVFKRHQLRSFLHKVGVRGGIGAETAMSLRPYHTQGVTQ